MKTIKELVAWLRGLAPDGPVRKVPDPPPPGPEVFLWRGRRYLVVNDTLVDPVIRKQFLKDWAAHDSQLRAVNLSRMANGLDPVGSLDDARSEDPALRQYTNI
jgi:hypothetical protein